MPLLHSPVITTVAPPAFGNALHSGLAISQLLALQVIRRSLDGSLEDTAWHDVGHALRRAHTEMLNHQHIGLVVADEGAVLPTRHERRLLRAASAAQIPDPALIDNIIFALAPGRDVRPFLTDAIVRLAAGLAHHGHRLPLSGPSGSC